MSGILTRLFSIRRGEERKTLLLYGMHLLFYVGLRWGDTASYALYISNWSAADLSLIFIGQAALGFSLGLIYTSFANRASNERILVIIAGATIVWLLSVQLLFATGSFVGRFGLSYMYFYLGFGAFGDLAALHFVNYLNDFYDTRGAKTALPLLISASIAGAILGGLSAPLLTATIGTMYVPLAWGVTLAGVIGCVYATHRLLPAEVHQIEQAQQAERQRGAAESALQSLRAGFRFVRGTSILRWLLLATLVLVILMKLLNFQATAIFKVEFQNDDAQMFDFFNRIDALANIAGLALSSLLFNRMLASLGVGWMNLVFPLLTLVSVGALRRFPSSLYAAILGRENDRVLKKVFRNPVDVMLYNSVQPQMKARARGFINGLIVPLGSLIAGLLVLLVKQELIEPVRLGSISLLIAIAAVLIALQLRTHYGRAMANLLGGDELALLRAGDVGFDQADPATIAQLEQRLGEAQDEGMTLFLAEIFYDLQGRAALGQLAALAAKRGPAVRAGIIKLVGDDWIGDPIVRELSLKALADPQAGVRCAAATALAGDAAAADDQTLLGCFSKLLADPDEAVRAAAIPPLIASGDFYYLAPAVQALSGWLEDRASAERRVLGMRVLAKSGDERLVRTLIRFLNDAAPQVRLHAIELIGDLCAATPLEPIRRLGLETLRGQLADEDEAVRLAAVESLGHFAGHEAAPALIVALSDRSFEVRRKACDAMPPSARLAAERALGSDNPACAESAAFIRARAYRGNSSIAARRARRPALECVEALARGAYAIHAQRQALRPQTTPGARLMIRMLREQADLLLDRIFWLVGALCDEAESQAIRDGLRSATPATCANAAEALETIVSPRLARLIAPLVESTALPDLARIGAETLAIAPPALEQIFQQTWDQLDGWAAQPADRDLVPNDGWLTAVMLYTMMEIYAATPAAANLAAPGEIRAILESTPSRQAPVTRSTAGIALAQLGETERRLAMERSMLTMIERVIFLKQVPVFGAMTVERLRILASISEEQECTAGQRIIAEGEPGDALYIIVSGRVSIQRQAHKAVGAIAQLAELGPREYFAEMALFDDEPHSADAVALTPTDLLLVRRGPLIALIRRYPDMVFGFFKVLNQRLREANARFLER
jgi:CRP/FNR family transcriptional regulator, cyclic AMP receptor protein